MKGYTWEIFSGGYLYLLLKSNTICSHFTIAINNASSHITKEYILDIQRSNLDIIYQYSSLINIFIIMVSHCAHYFHYSNGSVRIYIYIYIYIQVFLQSHEILSTLQNKNTILTKIIVTYDMFYYYFFKRYLLSVNIIFLIYKHAKHSQIVISYDFNKNDMFFK